ncbi:MAG: HAD-IB family phosphatase [Thermoplasmata archaeon]
MIELVAFDMDGTLVDVESSWAAVHAHFGDSNTESLRLFLENKLDDEAFIRSDIRIWWKHKPDLSIEDLETILARVPLMRGATELFASLHKRHCLTAIVSGGVDILARRIGRELGVDYVLANGFEVDSDGRLTGEGIVRVPIKRKEEVLAQVQRQLGVAPEATASVGNSEIDVGLFRRSRIRIAFHPEDDAVRAAATTVVEGSDMTPIVALLTESG